MSTPCCFSFFAAEHGVSRRIRCWRLRSVVSARCCRTRPAPQSSPAPRSAKISGQIAGGPAKFVHGHVMIPEKHCRCCHCQDHCRDGTGYQKYKRNSRQKPDCQHCFDCRCSVSGSFGKRGCQSILSCLWKTENRKDRSGPVSSHRFRQWPERPPDAALKGCRVQQQIDTAPGNGKGSGVGVL